jgi:hypothetical protein
MAPRLEPQLAMDEQAITNADLEAALEARLRAKDDVAEVNGVLKSANARVSTLLDAIDFPVDSALRVGRFRITKTHVPGRSVSFETEPSNRIRFALVDES